MKLTLASSSVIAAIVLAPAVGFAGDPIPGVNIAGGKNPGGQSIPWLDTCKRNGGTVIPAGNLSYCASAKAVDTCQSKGGSVSWQSGQTVCNLPK